MIANATEESPTQPAPIRFSSVKIRMTPTQITQFRSICRPASSNSTCLPGATALIRLDRYEVNMTGYSAMSTKLHTHCRTPCWKAQNRPRPRLTQW